MYRRLSPDVCLVFRLSPVKNQRKKSSIASAMPATLCYSTSASKASCSIRALVIWFFFREIEIGLCTEEGMKHIAGK